MDRKEMLDKIQEKITYSNETLYRCNRVWEAWNYGTMTRDDFEEVELSINLGDIFEHFVPNDIYIPTERNNGGYTEIGHNHLELIQLLNLYEMKDKPLYLQSDDCIEKLYKMLFH